MAGLIPQSFIDDLLQRLDIVDVVSARLPLKKTGKNYSACCPFHDEKNPSFTVSADKQLYYCFGCHAGGNALNFVMHYDHLEFPQAVEVLAQQVGLDVPTEATGTHIPESPLYGLLDSADAFYRQALRSHPQRHEAITYLKQRGVSGHIARDYGLGFAPPGWDHLLQHLGSSLERQQQLLNAGLLVESSDSGRRYDRFRHRLVFPIRDHKGRTLGFGGRVLGDDKPKYLNSPETPIFHKGQTLYGLFEARRYNSSLEEIIVVEGYMDVIALAQQGLSNTVATLGTATTSEHIRRLFKVVPRVVFCFDGDNAGRKAAWKALESTLPHLQDGYQARFLFLPDNEDPDSLIRQEGTEAFRQRLQQALSLSDYLFQHLQETVDSSTREGKAHLAKLANPLIQQIPGEYLRALMQQHLTQTTGLPELETLKPQDSPPVHPSSQVAPQRQHARQPSKAKGKKQQLSAVEPPSLTALRTLLHHPELAQSLNHLQWPAEPQDHYAQLLISLLETLQRFPKLHSLRLLARWHGTPQGRLLRNLAGKEWLIAQDNLEQQFFDTITKLVTRQQERRLEQLLHKAREQTLTPEEKVQLRTLLAQQHSSSPAATSSTGMNDKN